MGQVIPLRKRIEKAQPIYQSIDAEFKKKIEEKITAILEKIELRRMKDDI